MIIPEGNQVEKYGLHPGYVKRRKDQGGGFFCKRRGSASSALPGTFEKSHLPIDRIEALTVARTYYEKRHISAMIITARRARGPEVVRVHFGRSTMVTSLELYHNVVPLGHCLDILRQQLMCSADFGVFGQLWIKDVGPFVDFNTKHKCKISRRFVAGLNKIK